MVILKPMMKRFPSFKNDKTIEVALNDDKTESNSECWPPEIVDLTKDNAIELVPNEQSSQIQNFCKVGMDGCRFLPLVCLSNFVFCYSFVQ